MLIIVIVAKVLSALFRSDGTNQLSLFASLYRTCNPDEEFTRKKKRMTKKKNVLRF